MTLHGLGYVPDPQAPRPSDLHFGATHAHVLGAFTPPDVDEHLLPFFPGVVDQGQAEDCVGMSLAQNSDTVLAYEGHPMGHATSGSYIWWNSRHREGTDRLNVGTMIFTAVDAIGAVGLAPDKDWPSAQAEWNFADRPADIAFKHAFATRFDVRLYRVDKTEQAIRTALATLGPLTIGIAIDQAFDEMGPHASPIGPPDPGKVIGGHAVSILSTKKTYVDVPNTWGTAAGNDGWFKLGWDYVLSDQTSEVVAVRYVPRLWTPEGV